MNNHRFYCILLASVLFSSPGLVSAQVKSPTPTASSVVAPPLHPWQAVAPQATNEAYFANLQDGAKIETPHLVTFGLSGGWGLAPIAKPVSGKGGLTATSSSRSQLVTNGKGHGGTVRVPESTKQRC